MELKDFFGVDIDKYSYETNRILDLLGVRRTIEKTRQVNDLILAFDKNSIYVDVAKRQQLLLFLKPLLTKEFLPYDKNHEGKEVNTASDKDRRYNAEERLFKIVLSVVTAEKYSTLVDNEFKPDIAGLRSLNKDRDERYDRLKKILSNDIKPTLEQFKIDKKHIKPNIKKEKSFLSKLFKK